MATTLRAAEAATGMVAVAMIMAPMMAAGQDPVIDIRTPPASAPSARKPQDASRYPALTRPRISGATAS